MSTGQATAGRLAPECIRMHDIPRLPEAVIGQFRDLDDLTGTVADAMDKLGLVGVLPASVLAPNLAGARVAGQALTVRNVARRESVAAAAAGRLNRMGESEAYALACAGDVIVIEGLAGASNMGGQSATLAHRHGCAGAIIDGAYRDPEASRALGFPIWSRGVTPVTGKWRLETAEVNGTVRIGGSAPGVSVAPGDLVIADEAGIAVVPFAWVEAVLAEARRIDAGDRKRKRDIADGVDLASLNQRSYK